MNLNEGLIVSCQALKDEPMYGGDTIPKFAYAAFLGGANGIRANTIKDINRIHKKIKGSLPIIGIIKQVYSDSDVYITPTLKEVKKLIKSKCDIIAIDATPRKRHNDEKLETLVSYIRQNSNKKIFADCSTLNEMENAQKLGFDYISTTLVSYTSYTSNIVIPDFKLLDDAINVIDENKLVYEGGIDSPQTLRKVLEKGIKYVVVGGAITRPLQITKRYKNEFNKKGEQYE